MSTKYLCGLAISSLVATQIGFAQEKPAEKATTPPTARTAPAAPKSPAALDVQEAMRKFQVKYSELRKAQTEKLKADPAAKVEKISEADVAAELKAFDAVLAKYKGEKSDDVAQALSLKSMIYAQALGDYDKALATTEQLKKDFPDTKAGLMADKTIESLQKQLASSKIREGLTEGAKFPDFNVKDVNGKPLSIANYKGKVVLIDFWATWCPPCRAEVPNVVAVYNKYHDKGFEIIGISLDRENDKGKLESYTKENNMPWQQFFDGKYWQNELAAKYGVNSIPAVYLLDREGRILGKGDAIRGENLEGAVAKALGKG